MDTSNLDQMLTQLRAAAAVAQKKPAESTSPAGGADFSQALKTAIDQVNQAQQQAQQIAEDFSTGKNNVNLQDVMIDLQKANLSFQQMVQVRNKLVTAYNDIMNMQL
ncbi:MAG TPA: flagellar hook-basal body complex protein FliE [Rhodocyclaceae bacterium]|nr:flagellar hook-basal body complex protein FliE [Rhodocyclaceae bacterium]